MIDVSFILIGYNEKQRVINCINSIKKLKTKYTYEICYVDNASHDDTVDYIIKTFKEVRVISLKKNIGTPAYNKGITFSKGKYIFFAPSDYEFEKHMLDNLVKFLEKHKECCHAAPKYYNLLDKKKIDLAGTWLSRAFYSGTFKDETLKNRIVEIPHMGPGLVRAELVKKLRYIFDDDYFIYGEDVDFGLRLRLTGAKIYYVPSSIVYHVGSVSRDIHPHAYLTFLMERNLLTTMFKILQWRSIAYCLPYAIFMRIAATTRDVIKLDFLNAFARFKAIFWIFSNISTILKKRHQTQKLRKVTDKELFKVFSEKYFYK